jgi:outer membrane protein assembly factor BamE
VPKHDQYSTIRYYRGPIITQSQPAQQKILLMRNLPLPALPVLSLLLVITLLTLPVTGCVYRVDVQQGNLLEDKEVEAIKVGMTRSQVRFLLGTPAISDPFHADRWDYIYYFRQGRKRTADRAWLIVYFDGDRVREIQRDVPVEPS